MNHQTACNVEGGLLFNIGGGYIYLTANQSRQMILNGAIPSYTHHDNKIFAYASGGYQQQNYAIGNSIPPHIPFNPLNLNLQNIGQFATPRYYSQQQPGQPQQSQSLPLQQTFLRTQPQPQPQSKPFRPSQTTQPITVVRQYVPIRGPHPMLVSYQPPSMFQQLFANCTKPMEKDQYLQRIPSITSLAGSSDHVIDRDDDCSILSYSECSSLVSTISTVSLKDSREMQHLKEEIFRLKQRMKNHEREHTTLQIALTNKSRQDAGFIKQLPVRKILKSQSYPSLASNRRFIDLSAIKPSTENDEHSIEEDILRNKLLNVIPKSTAKKVTLAEVPKVLVQKKDPDPFTYPTGKLELNPFEKLPKLQ